MLNAPTPTTIACNSSNRNGCINQYLNANALNGIVIALFCSFFLIFGLLLLFYVQTPTVLSNQPVDFGKIEK
jgi:hypothetical protein